MALHVLHIVGQRRFQTLAADVVKCFADQDHGLSHGLVIDAPAVDAKPLILSAAPAAEYRACGGSRLR